MSGSDHPERSGAHQQRRFEESIETDLTGRLTYGSYLALDRILNAQHPVSPAQPTGEPFHHDEMLFIIQHQTSELWMKLVIHELRSAIASIAADRLDPCFKILSRVKQVQQQLFSQWAVLETMTPNEYAKFRSYLGPASGFQSAQYRTIEFLLNNKDANALRVFAHAPELHASLREDLNKPSIYDEFLRYLARKGYEIPDRVIDRDFSAPYEPSAEVERAFLDIYRGAEGASGDWNAYEMCEKLVDIDEQFALWRFRHMKTVERIIGFKRGTGGSSGVGFLRQAVDIRAFPELWSVRTSIGA
ncbi:MAG: tryptophan 2,3-dioxygenase [Phycisphaerales bacterium]